MIFSMSCNFNPSRPTSSCHHLARHFAMAMQSRPLSSSGQPYAFRLLGCGAPFKNNAKLAFPNCHSYCSLHVISCTRCWLHAMSIGPQEQRDTLRIWQRICRMWYVVQTAYGTILRVLNLHRTSLESLQNQLGPNSLNQSAMLSLDRSWLRVTCRQQLLASAQKSTYFSSVCQTRIGFHGSIKDRRASVRALNRAESRSAFRNGASCQVEAGSLSFVLYSGSLAQSPQHAQVQFGK